LQAAAAWLAANPNPPAEAIEAQPWPPAVKALVHYPNVLTQLTGDMQWTQSLGSAFTNQPADVSAAIQQMRAQASAQGNLVTTPQQTVIQDGGVISIQPVSTEIVYVPTYDPVLVYVGYHPLIWGVGYPCGPWFTYGCDWYGGGFVFVGDWHGGFYYGGGGWHRDYAWHGGGYARFQHDARFGPPPHVEREHFAVARGVAGREAELHRSMEARATERHSIQRVASRAPAARPEMSRTPSRTTTPERNTVRPSAEHGNGRPGAEHSEHAEGRGGRR
jgi:hypothetical protein